MREGGREGAQRWVGGWAVEWWSGGGGVTWWRSEERKEVREIVG